MISVEKALKKILNQTKPLPPIHRPLLKSLGHLLATDIFSPEPLPSFTNSAMDGYAVCLENRNRFLKPLKVIEEIPAGKFPKEKIKQGTAARIMTGAPLPQGADAVVPLEQTEILEDGSVRILSQVQMGQFIRQRGEEIQLNERIFSKGHLLKPEDLGLLASLGLNEIAVIPKPSISLVTTGSEVIAASQQPKLGQIRNSNLISMAAALTHLGYPIHKATHVKDSPRALKSIFKKCTSDVIISIGGVSVGKYDFIKKVLLERGKIIFWKVAMKPGKPFLFGRIGRSYFFGLPGNPVSALVTFEILVKPALLALSGHKNRGLSPRGQSPIFPAKEKAVLTCSIKHNPDLQEYVRARVHKTKGGLKITPLAQQGSHMLRSLTEANAWIVLPQKIKNFSAGSTVHFLPQ